MTYTLEELHFVCVCVPLRSTKLLTFLNKYGVQSSKWRHNLLHALKGNFKYHNERHDYVRQKQQPASPMLGDNSRSSNNKSQLLTESTKTPTNQTAKANHSTKQSSNHSASQPTKLTSSRVMQWVWDWQPQQRQLAPSPSRQCKQIFMYQKNDKLIELTLKAEINYTTVSCRMCGNVGRQGRGGGGIFYLPPIHK